jgi:hypothetical protein
LFALDILAQAGEQPQLHLGQVVTGFVVGVLLETQVGDRPGQALIDVVGPPLVAAAEVMRSPSGLKVAWASFRCCG